mgnify:CR=1 FL=1
MSNKIFSTIWLTLFGLAFLVSCGQNNQTQALSLHGKTMGTSFNIKYFPSEKTPSVELLLTEVNQALVRINQLMSTYIPDSELSRLNKTPAGVEFNLSEETVFVLNEALRINKMSEGAFDVTVGPLVNLWGFGPNGRITKQPSIDLIAQTNHWVGSDKVQLNEHIVVKLHDKTYIDFSAIAKGYGVDKVAELLESKGVNSYLVEIGGELRINGTKPDGSNWKVAVEKPIIDHREAQLIFAPGNMGMATSGDYRNYFEQNGVRFSHTIDATTGSPITHNLASVTVLDPSAARADAYATTINVLGAEKGLEFAEKYNIAAYMLIKSPSGFEEVISSGFKPFLSN